MALDSGVIVNIAILIRRVHCAASTLKRHVKRSLAGLAGGAVGLAKMAVLTMITFLQARSWMSLRFEPTGHPNLLTASLLGFFRPR